MERRPAFTSPVPFQNLARLHESIQEELASAFGRVLRTGAFIQGEHVRGFEKDFAAYTGASICIGVGNGTDAIELSLEALGIGKGDLVAVPSLTFVATVEPIVRIGAKPLFVDVDPETLCITPQTLCSSLSKSNRPIKALIAVHLYGRACDMPGILELSRKEGFAVIEDCAQAHGARIAGKHVGTFGEIGTFSFYPGKNLGALGDAGAVITSNEEVGNKIRSLRDHGRKEKYLHEQIGRNSRLDGLQALFLQIKLRKLEDWVERRRGLARFYQDELGNLPGAALLPLPQDPRSHALHLLVMRIRNDRRDALKKQLSKAGFETGIHYPMGVHMQPAFRDFSGGVDLPVTERAVSEILSLPLDPLMSKDEVIRVCAEVRGFFHE